ncbi:MAG: ParB/RepB/Spo0J family partition protein, partial [bacterium]
GGDAEAVEDSLAENIVRAPVHPADQFEAFARLQKQGFSAEDIAARFGIEPGVVLHRLKLARVSSRLIAEYRKGEMALEQLMAFTVSDDHRAQEEIWFDHLVGYSSPGDIRRLLTKSLIEGSDRRARFVGAKAYEEAGGAIVRDLFQSESEGYFTDSGLLDRLAAKKLQGEAFAVKAEGWGWVEVRLETDFSYLAGFRRLPITEIRLSAAEEKRLTRLCERYDELVDGIEDEDEAKGSVLDSVTKELNELQAKKETWPEEERMKAGVIVSLNAQGQVHITRGLIRQEDGGEAASGQDKEAQFTRKHASNGYSASLLADLAAHKTAALREVLANAPDTALVALLEALVPQVFGSAAETCVDVMLKPVDLTRYSESVGESKAAAAFLARHETWLKRMPEDGQLWSWLTDLSQPEQLALLAHCVATAVNGVGLHPEDGRNQCTDALEGRRSRHGGLVAADGGELL